MRCTIRGAERGTITIPAMKPCSAGVIGIGNMGLAMAERLRDRGHAVAVRDVRAAREALAQDVGARVCATPAALARPARW